MRKISRKHEHAKSTPHYSFSIRKTFLLFLLFTAKLGTAQSGNIGIGTRTPGRSAILDITDSTNSRGVLIPRMTAANRAAISTNLETNGLLVYQTNGISGFYYHNNGEWWNLTEGVRARSDGSIDTSGVGSIYATSSGILKGLLTNSVTTPSTGSNNMLAAAYGCVYSNATTTFASSSDNCTLSHTNNPTNNTGTYTITFTKNLAGADLRRLPVMVSLYGNGSGLSGFISCAGTANGSLTVYTFNNGGTAADRGFSFVVYKPQ